MRNQHGELDDLFNQAVATHALAARMRRKLLRSLPGAAIRLPSDADPDKVLIDMLGRPGLTLDILLAELGGTVG